MHQGHLLWPQGGCIGCQFAPIGVGAQVVLGNVTENLYRLSPHIQRISLLFSQVQQPSSRRLLILIARNQDGCLLAWGKPGRVPGTGATREHSTTADDTGRWPCQQTFSLPFVTYKGYRRAGEGRVSLANLPLQDRREGFGEQQ